MNPDFKFVHAADLHLDSPLLGLETYRDAPVDVIRDATREALKKLVELCIDEKVGFLLIAGDAYDGDWKSIATGRFFAEQMARLNNAGIPVFLIKGNHDAASLITREMVLPGVYTFDHKKPESVLVERFGVAIHGQSYARRDVTDDLSASYPPPIAGLFNIGMLHTCGTGGSTIHEPYAPCNIDDLIRKGYDYWALGHVHQRAVLNDDPPVVFPGNIQGRHVREPAPEGKGATLVEVQGERVVALTHIPLDTVRWMHLEIDVEGAKTAEAVVVRIGAGVRSAADACDGRFLATRVTISGSCPASLEIHKDLAAFDTSIRTYVQGTVPDVWIEEIRVHTHSDSLEAVLAGKGSLGDLLEFVRESGGNGRLGEVQDRLSALRDRIRSSAPELVVELGLDNDQLLESLLPDVEEAILALATGAGK